MESTEPATVGQIASAAGVSERTVRQIKAATKAGLGDPIRAGQLSPKAAASVIRKQTGNWPATSGAQEKSPRSKPRAWIHELEAQVTALKTEVLEKTREIEELNGTITALRDLLAQMQREYRAGDQANNPTERSNAQARQPESGPEGQQAIMYLDLPAETAPKQPLHEPQAAD